MLTEAQYEAWRDGGQGSAAGAVSGLMYCSLMVLRSGDDVKAWVVIERPLLGAMPPAPKGPFNRRSGS